MSASTEALQALDRLGRSIDSSPPDIELARRYWALARRAGLASGLHVERGFRKVADASREGFLEYVAAYRALFDSSGETPSSRLVPAHRVERAVLMADEPLGAVVQWFARTLRRGP